MEIIRIIVDNKNTMVITDTIVMIINSFDSI